MQFSKVLKESRSKVWQECLLRLQLSAADEVEIVEQNRSLLLSAASVPFGSPVQASWSVPVDEATNKDWIGQWVNSFRPYSMLFLSTCLHVSQEILDH